MKCWVHQENDAVGVCAYCGKAVCPECAISIPSGRIVCSSSCIDRVNNKYEPLKVWFLYGIVILFAATCLVSLIQGYYGMAALMGIASVITLMAAAYGTSGEAGDRSYGELYWRAGMALLEAQRFRRNLITFIPLHNQLTGESVTLQEFDSLDPKEQSRKLIDIIGAACRHIGKTPPDNFERYPVISESLKHYEEVTNNFFVQRDDLFDVQHQRNRAIRNAMHADQRLRETNVYLSTLNENIRKHLQSKEQPG